MTAPFGCKLCGESERGHGYAYSNTTGTFHTWLAPTDAQVLARMLARRAGTC